MEKEDKIYVDMENLAMPEVRLGADEEEDFDDEDETDVNYSGAVPEINISRLTGAENKKTGE